MVGLLRKLRPVVPTIPENVDDEYYSTDYSIAMEYHGPPVTYDIPQLFPVSIDKIPLANPVSSASLMNNLSLPIIQPIVKSSKKSALGSQAIRIDSSGSLGCEKISDELEVPDIPNNSQELLEVPDDDNGVAGIQDYMNPTNWELTESGLSSRSLSSEVFSVRDDDGNKETPHHARRPSTVRFRDPESCDMVEVREDSEYSDNVKPKVERNVKKGVCYRCLKGNRFTDKEVCVVCEAKYCYDCVLRAMGSMPEGRKCVTCIGYRIDEGRRGMLGKRSRMLKRLLTNSQVKTIMSAEVMCEVNQLPPSIIFVNGEPLNKEKLVLLQKCKNPPKKLRPGNYWYDKVSGFWGKEGEMPCQIISDQLDVGGRINRNASNGNTDVSINDREITKKELFMLKFAGVPCEGKPHFWVSADGSYQEEGQKNIKGKIWDKTKTKIVCKVLSLPVPVDSEDPRGEEMSRSTKNNPQQKSLYKLLLVGYNESGTSTIYKQAKVLYNVPFSKDERETIKLVIQRNLYGYLGILLEGCERFEEESLLEKRKRQLLDKSQPSGNTSQIEETTIYSIGPRVKAISNWFFQFMESSNFDPTDCDEYAPFVKEVWEDAAIQATYNRRNELEMLPRVATYFLDRAVEISGTDYEPTDTDILYAGGITSSNSLACMEFSFPKSARDDSGEPAYQNDLTERAYQHDPSLRYQLIRVHPRSLGENCKWLDMFEDADILLFCVSLTDYNEYSEDSNGVSTNKMLASKQLFERIVTHPTSKDKNFLLLLNKFDLLEEMVEQIPLKRCEWFHDFNPVTTHNHHNNTNPSLAHRAFHYMAVKFKKLFHDLTDRKLFVSLVTGLENDTVDESLRYAREVVMWKEEEPYSLNENSSYTDNEPISTS